MKKVLCLTLLLLSMICGICTASPLDPPSLGQVSFDVNFSAPTLSGNSESADGKLSIGYDVAAGFGLGFSGQYSYNEFKAKTPINGNNKLKAQQLNLNYNLIDLVARVSVFVGASQTEMIGSSRQDGVVVGVTGSVPFAPHARAYATLSTGTHVASYEAGLGYKFTDNLEFFLAYRDTKYKELAFANGSTEDITVKGHLGGLAYKF